MARSVPPVPSSLFELQISTFGQPWTTVSASLKGSCVRVRNSCRPFVRAILLTVLTLLHLIFTADMSLSVAELEPATPYIFRARGRGTFAWGPFSPASEAFTTAGDALAGPSASSDPAELYEEALLGVKREIWALQHMPADSARTAIRKLKMRYHPDKAPANRRELFLELSKHINTETATLSGNGPG